jgi:hypothetical protein
MTKKGYYIKKSRVDQSLYLYIEINDFIKYIKESMNDKGDTWLKFRIFEREKQSEQFSHDMQIIK